MYMHAYTSVFAIRIFTVLEISSSNWSFSGHFPLYLEKIAFDWINCLISYKNNTTKYVV